MSRPATGTVEWRGSPPRWHARITVKIDSANAGSKPKKPRRVWVDLERPDLQNTPEDKERAKHLARRYAKKAKADGSAFVGEAASAPVSSATLRDFEDAWFALLDRNPQLAAKTRDRYKVSWRQVLARFGDFTLAEITPVAIRDWLWARQQERSQSTVHNETIALSRFFEDVIANGWAPITTNPVRDRIVRAAKPDAPHNAPEDIVRYTREQLERLLAAEGMPDDVFGLTLADALTGARCGEARALQFKHLRDPRDGKECVRILQQVVETADRELSIADPKRGSKRTNPMHSQLAPWLAWWKTEGWKRFVGRAPTEDDFVFPDATGAKCRPRDAEILRRWARKAGVPDAFVREDGSHEPFTFNALRRTFASLLADLDVDGEVIDELLGHKRRTVRGRHYQGDSFERKQRAVERLRLALPARPGVARESSSNRPPPNPAKNESTEVATSTPSLASTEPHAEAPFPERSASADAIVKAVLKTAPLARVGGASTARSKRSTPQRRAPPRAPLRAATRSSSPSPSPPACTRSAP